MIGRLFLKLAALWMTRERWNKLLIWLFGQAPKLFGGKYAAYEHGQKSRQWFYPIWKGQADKASDTPGLWDDSGCEYIRGFMSFDLEAHTVVANLEQVLADVTADQKGQARERLAEVIRVLKGPT